MNFQNLREAVADYAQLSLGENQRRIDRCLNMALMLAQQRHPFENNKDFGVGTYPANQFLVDVNALFSANNIKALHSVQLLDTATDTRGVPLPIEPYEQLVERMRRWQGNYIPTLAINDIDQMKAGLMTEFEEYLRLQAPYIVFTRGKDFGLYPTPTEDKYLLLHYTNFLSDLSADSDSNFLTESGWNWMMLQAVAYLNVGRMDPIKQSWIPLVSKNQLDVAWEAITRWDSSTVGQTNQS